MTTFEKIVDCLKELKIPCFPDIYSDTEKQWITYNYSDDYGTDYADDEPETVINSVQVHLFMPAYEPFAEIKTKIRSLLFSAGFTFPEVTVLTEDDDKTRHIIFECDIEEEK